MGEAWTASYTRMFLEQVNRPVVFSGYISHWPSASWSPRSMSGDSQFGGTKLMFRVGHSHCEVVDDIRNSSGEIVDGVGHSNTLNDCKISPPCPKKSRFGDQDSSEVLWEKDCQYKSATIHDFCTFIEGRGDGALGTPGLGKWVYADYKYMPDIFPGNDKLLDSVQWDVFGYAGRTGLESTLWVGSSGAYTPCHYDTYGFNLVAQIYGRKRWTLFSPEDTCKLYPTRVPFEESSVFSSVNIRYPDVCRHPRFLDATPLILELNPGEVLFVPKHWWHFVECLEPSISINTWIELESDHEDRCTESLAALLTGAIVDYGRIDPADIYNPREEPMNIKTALNSLRTSLHPPNGVTEIAIGVDSAQGDPACGCCLRSARLIGEECSVTTTNALQLNKTAHAIKASKAYSTSESTSDEDLVCARGASFSDTAFANNKCERTATSIKHFNHLDKAENRSDKRAVRVSKLDDEITAEQLMKYITDPRVLQCILQVMKDDLGLCTQTLSKQC